MTKERLNCYDAIVPPEPIAAAPKARTVLECRFLREEDERIICFNGFLRSAVAAPASPGRPTAVVPAAPRHPTAAVPAAAGRPLAERRPSSLKVEIDVVSKASPTTHQGAPEYPLAERRTLDTPAPSKQVWMRTDGQLITGNAKLQQQFEGDRADCLKRETVDLVKYCMLTKGYEMVPAAEAERLAATKRAALVVSKTRPTTVVTGHTGGCGSRGGPGYRLASGKCASSHHSRKHGH
jgi:hypothetical protein